MHEFYRGDMPTPPHPPTGQKFSKIGLLERHILHSLDRTQLIDTFILFYPSRSTKIHDSQVFKTKIHDYFMFCNYDSWFRFN